jgi:hypothetical protein
MIKSRKVRLVGHVKGVGEKRNAYRVSGGKPEGKKQLRRPRCIWEDNIKMDSNISDRTPEDDPCGRNM